MSLFKKIRTRQDIALITEEKLYSHVGQEISEGHILQGLWTKATAQSESTCEESIKKKYIELRVEYLRAEGRLYEQFFEEALVGANANPKVDRSKPPQLQSTKITKATVESVRQEIENGSIHTDLWERAKTECQDSDNAAIEDRYVELRLQSLNSRFNCPFCQNIMSDYGRCSNCGNTVDKWVLEDAKK